MRVGWGVDAHRFQSEGTVLVGGVVADETRGISATSDGDVAVHALIDAVLGAAALGDIGMQHPSDAPRSQGADSLEMLREAVARVSGAGYSVSSVDVTLVSQSVRIGPIRDRVRLNLAAALGIGVDRVSVKGTSTDALGFTGRDEGMAALAVAVLDES